MVPDSQSGRPVAGSRCELPGLVAKHGCNPRLVVGDPVLDPVTEALGHDARVANEGVDCFPIAPASLVLKGLGQIPVIEGGVRPDSILE